jgi:hypothetical protein
MGPFGVDLNKLLESCREGLGWSMWFFLGTAMTAVVVYGSCLLQQRFLPRNAKRATKTLECGGEYEQPEIP